MTSYIKKLSAFLLLIFTIDLNYSIAQEYAFSDVHPCIRKFYEHLYKDSRVSISEFKKSYSNTGEASFILHCCKQGKSGYCKIIQNKGNIFEKLKDSDTSCIFYEIKNRYFNELTQGVQFENINLVIDNLKIHYDGGLNEQYAILTFPNKKKVYFQLNADTAFIDFPADISDIYLNNGDNLMELINESNPWKLKWIGIINPNNKQRFVNLYVKPDLNSVSNSRILPNQIFYFTPIGDSEWWPVYDYNDDKTFLGYIRKSEVVMFENFPEKLKKKLLDFEC